MIQAFEPIAGRCSLFPSLQRLPLASLSTTQRICPMLQLSVPCSAKNERTFPKLGLMLAVQPCKCLGELTHAQTLCSWLTKMKLANTLKSDPATLKMSHRIPAGKGDGDGAQSHPLLPAAPRCKPTGQESKLDEKCQNCFQKTRCRRRRESNLAKRA